MERQSLDLLAFFKMILRHFILIVFVTAVGAATGWGLAYLQTPKWKATAQIDKPKVPELGNYFALFSTYQFLNGGTNPTYKLTRDEDGSFNLGPQILDNVELLAIDGVYNEFKRNLVSPDILQEFLQQSEIVKSLAADKKQPVIVAAQELAERFLFQPATKSTPAERMSVSLENPEQANQMLIAFMHYANQRTKMTLNNDLIQKWKILFNQIKSAVEQNLGAIQQAGYIASQDWNGKLNIMRNVAPLDDNLVAFRYVKQPSVPLAPDSPNHLFWLMIGTLSGFLLGIAIVVVLNLRKGNEN